MQFFFLITTACSLVD